MTKMEKLPGKTMDLVQHNIDNLKQLFPEVVTEGKIDFEKLKLVLGENVENNEKYEFTWSGKSDAIKLAQTPSLGTLRPDKESSKNWDETENVYIEGDNLEVLKLLQKSYFGKVKMIYIDPPYNTGKDFVYKDNFRDNIQNYKEQTGQTSKANVETSGRYHTDWLNMIYPRLKLARNLLREDGMIFISIDDNEEANLKKVCDEVFGEDNFLATAIWKQNHTLRNSSPHFSANTEYVLVYIKNISTINRSDVKEFLRYPKDKSLDYPYDDNDGKGKYKLDVLHARNYSKPYVFTFSNGVEWEAPKGRYPAFSRENLKRMESENEIVFSGKEPKMKRYLSRVQQGIAPATLLPTEIVGYSKDGTQDLAALFPDNKMFEQPKPVKLVEYLLSIESQRYREEALEPIILDFFSGSGTTAQAIMNLNVRDSRRRKYIMIQLPEEIDSKWGILDTEYKNICQIGKERIRRAGEMIVKEHEEIELDTGFKVFRLDNSNIKQWNTGEEFEDLLSSLENNIVSGRTNEDLLYEILLKIGLPLTAPIEIIDINGKIVYDVAFGSVLLCLDDDITLDVVGEMLNCISEDIETKVVFKEIGFRDDTVKTNVIQTLKKHGVKEDNIRSV